jgi:hypothetical protein
MRSGRQVARETVRLGAISAALPAASAATVAQRLPILAARHPHFGRPPRSGA